MLRILGSARKLASGVSRRDLLRAGSLGVGGLSLAEVLQLQQLAAGEQLDRPQSFGRAKQVILLHLYGSPSQLEFVDPKPDAPLEIRGELGSIPSSLPGCDVCELLPNLATVMDRTTVLRSMTHPYPIHGVAYALTAVPQIDVAMELSRRDSRHWPFFGSVVKYLEDQQGGPARPAPTNIALPFPFSSQREGEVPRAGPYGAFLGRQYDPVFPEFAGTATRGHIKELGTKTFTDNDPYVGVADDCHFALPGSSKLREGITLDRLNSRLTLMEQMNNARGALEASSAARRLSKHQAAALAVLNNNVMSQALDVRREDQATRELYGMTLFGQACLTARRLIEAGSRVVTVFWDEYGLAGSGWDTHWHHYDRMKQELCPGLDLAWRGLIVDLERRGLLDETLVVCTSEHGRTPKLKSDPKKGAGRDHWSRAYSTLLAGGGTAPGQVLGATDKHGADVIERPISPKDVQATMYHLLGIDPHRTIPDRSGRPLPLVSGRVIHEALL